MGKVSKANLFGHSTHPKEEPSNPTSKGKSFIGSLFSGFVSWIVSLFSCWGSAPSNQANPGSGQKAVNQEGAHPYDRDL